MKHYYLLLVLLLSFTAVSAQEMLGIANSNYAGTNGVYLNPSSMVSGRLRLDVNVLSGGLSLENNYIYQPQRKLKFFGLKRIYDNFGEDQKGKGFTDEKNWDAKDLSRTYSGTFSSITRLPSVLFRIKENYFHVALLNARSVFAATDIPAPLVKFVYEDQGLAYSALQQKNLNFKEFRLDFVSWFESGITYGRPIIGKGEHFLSGAVTLKYLQGFYSAYIKSEDARIFLDSTGFTDTVTVDYADMSYGYSYNEDDDGLDFIKGRGFGADIGFTYEYRPENQQHHYEIDGKKLLDPSKNQYLFKIGLSFIDLGKIKFEDATVFRLRANDLVISEYDTINFEDNVDFDTTLSNYAYGDPDESYKGDKYDLALPHAISLQADFHAWKGAYANLTWINPIASDGNGPRANGLLALIPRYEWKWYEVAIPLSLHRYDKFRFGFAFRAYGLTLGSDNLGGLMKMTDLEGLDIYGSLKVPLTKERIRDTDGDGVSDKRDKCMFEKGTWETMGCPDRDGDGIIDKEDACPDVKGVARFQGCPDTDNDGVQDKEDDCPQIAGLVQFKGCPDTDNDSIPDPQDSCATTPGLPQFFGCPDTDGDNISDPNDDCPTEKGSMQYKGCPDTDGDGLINKLDSCPQVAGPVSNHGCPVVEKVKREPVRVELTKEEAEVINKVFQNLEFETGKSVIRQSSFSALDELSELLKKKPNFKLLVDGHTDNVGKAAYNLKLSQNRANAVKKYLTEKGIDASRITAKGYGMNKPIASNKTPEGRQKNRRVEFTIVE
jgi:outer membrane protein OmpA-like peptidoglycan-associated protein